MTGQRRMSTAVFADLPDHEYWNKQKGPYPSLSTVPSRTDKTALVKPRRASSVASGIAFPPSSIPRPSAGSIYGSDPVRDRSASTYSRRLSRKLPPRVTESLENLAIIPTLATSPGAAFSPLARLASISSELPVVGNNPTAAPAPIRFSSEGRRPSTYSLIPALPLIQSSPTMSSPATMPTAAPLALRPAKASPAPAPVPVPSPVQTPARPLPVRTSSLASKKSNSSKRRPSISVSIVSAPILTPSSSAGAEPESAMAGSGAHHMQLEPTIRQMSSVPSLSHSARTSASSFAPSTVSEHSLPALHSSHFARLAAGQTHGNDHAAVPALTCSPSSQSACGSWAVLDDIEQAERAARIAKPKESRKQKKERKQREAEDFDQQRHPAMGQLFEAGELEVIDEDGLHVKFGDLVSRRKTVVIFIRHWFCSLCAQYMKSIVREVSPEALDAADVDMIIIGNGSNKMIDGYRNKHFKCPFKMYTDPSLRLYRALGLTRQTGDSGADEDAGDYLTQSVAQQTVETIKRATRMPLRRPGHFLQLGGEFVFDGPLCVTYTNRMTTTRDHRPIRDVVAAAGVRLEFVHFEPGPAPPPVHRPAAEVGPDGAADDWEAERAAQLERIQARKALRRRGAPPAISAPTPLARAISDPRAAAVMSATVTASVTATLKVGMGKTAVPFTPMPLKPSVMRRNSSVNSGRIRIVQASENVEEVHGEVGTVF